MESQITIRPMGKTELTAMVPGSKSYTHRMLICAALADGLSQVKNGLVSEDTLLTMNALNKMGVSVRKERGSFWVNGTGGSLGRYEDPIHLGNSGTTLRLMCAVAAMGVGTYTLTGTERMQQRPILDLAQALEQLGVPVETNNGCPPIKIQGTAIKGGKVSINCGVSSQYLSALLLIAPYTQDGMEITVTEGPVSKPYIDMTVSVMKAMGVEIKRDGHTWFSVPGQSQYQAGEYMVEADASGASYFWGAAAITGATIRVAGTHSASCQGDSRFAYILKSMGCRLDETDEGLAVAGRDLKGITVDMGNMPDVAPTLAVVAAFAKGETRIENVGHLKAKESDRITAVITELKKMGVQASCTDDSMTIIGGKPKGAVIDTYDDHRIAMSFAVAGLLAPGVIINNPSCVDKSFPNFWEEWEKLY
ncbi:3-phosphoshikimate 1-carboxyvinyltransferase [Desulfatibacillum aliphaticivorans]|uniref:3-phosphoshikimate 1-carboxyvinyltransferase n=1 Tax=Desulfatibacillum aliphaticivorans TaxID=218208 RepID=B8FFQ4_DESAL|nr:3-phosphoshikimate 1-carboxyvinyltransferase [Desulfatibacillum aliphaticivorans]ACL03459.1 3-phosphoshikimate 1-carboxyvinyltransferase [Desulfatibacillum aliphaticivorans]